VAAQGDQRHRNGLATWALILGAAGVTLVTVIPAVLAGALGLRRAGAPGTGRARCWAGIVLAVRWTLAAEAHAGWIGGPVW
jgi:hypothetical protein